MFANQWLHLLSCLLKFTEDAGKTEGQKIGGRLQSWQIFLNFPSISYTFNVLCSDDNGLEKKIIFNHLLFIYWWPSKGLLDTWFVRSVRKLSELFAQIFWEFWKNSNKYFVIILLNPSIIVSKYQKLARTQRLGIILDARKAGKLSANFPFCLTFCADK